MKVFKADHSKATGIQKLGQILYLNDKINTRLKTSTSTDGGVGVEVELDERNV